jgi:hypothetical protein
MKATSFRLPESTLHLDALAEKLDLTLTQAVILAIDRMAGDEREKRPPEMRSVAAPTGALEGNIEPRAYPRWKYHPTERPRMIGDGELPANPIECCRSDRRIRFACRRGRTYRP